MPLSFISERKLKREILRLINGHLNNSEEKALQTWGNQTKNKRLFDKLRGKLRGKLPKCPLIRNKLFN